MARVRLSVAERREELLRAAVEQIEARGVAAVRIADVASALGVSNALVLYHFSTKEKLVAAAFTTPPRTTSPICGSCSAAARPRCTGCAPRSAGTRRPAQAKGWRLWIEGWAAALREPALLEVTRDLDRQWKAALTEVIAEGVAAGEFRCPDPVGTALRLTALLDGLAVQMTAYGGAVSRARTQQWADEALARELGLERAALVAGPR